MKQTANGKMIALARETRSISQIELAEKLNITQGLLSKLENEILQSSNEYIESISKALDYPVSFFYQEDSIFQLESFYYRKNRNTSKKILSSWEAIVNVTRINIEKLVTNVNIPETNYSHWNIETAGSPSDCARSLRQRWGVPRGPIEDLTNLLENNGIIVSYINFDSEIDGISIDTRKAHPIICLNKCLSPDRKRLTLAHELGHLLMHFDDVPSQKERNYEEEAFEFASEFLMPERDIKPQLIKLNFKKLADLKVYWKVSMSAILYRARRLNSISESQNRYVRAQLNSKGWRINEPNLFPSEEATIIKEIIKIYQNSLDYTQEEIASFLHISINDLKEKYLEDKVRMIVTRNL